MNASNASVSAINTSSTRESSFTGEENLSQYTDCHPDDVLLLM